jgi:hypothetical protein
MNDTLPEIERTFRELMMRRSGVERMEMAARMFEAARTIVISSLPSGLPDLEVKVRLCERFYRTEVDVRAFSQALRHNCPKV